MKIAILGAGITGLELGRSIHEKGGDFFVLEKESSIGGLCRTVRTGDFSWDFAVHALYSRDTSVMDYLTSLPLDYEYLSRNVKIFHRRGGQVHILEYPFEIGIKDLPLAHKLECVKGYLAVRMRKAKPCTNLQDFIDNYLGEGIARHFMLPYNRKIWNSPLSEISERLVSSKIEPASAIEFLSSILGKKVVGRAYQAKFIYPRKGIQHLMDYTAKDFRERISLDWPVERLQKQENRWIICGPGGRQREADLVISTIPLVELIRKVEVEGLGKEYGVFRWNDTYFIMVGLKKGFNFRIIEDCHWVFFKEDELFYRITLMHNFSSGFSPVLVAEVTCKGHIRGSSEEELKEGTVNDLLRLGIIASRDQIAETDIRLVEYTYPILTVGLEEVKKQIADLLQTQNIYLVGRNGYWDYINIDGAIQKARAFVQEFLAGRGLLSAR